MEIHSFINKRQRGAALVIALAISALVSLLLVMAVISIQRQGDEARLIRAAILAQNKVESVESELIYFLVTTKTWMDGIVDHEQISQSQRLNFHGEVFDWSGAKVSITDAQGYISLYPFDKNAFMQLLTAFNVDEHRREVIIDSILDWQDPDDFTHLFGAEHQDYSIDSYPTNQPFKTKKELCNVKGMDADLCVKLMPFLILYGSDTLLLQKAPTNLLTLLVGEERAELIISQRQPGATTGISLGNSIDPESYNPYPSDKLKIKIEYEIRGVVAKRYFTLTRAKSTVFGVLVSYEDD